MTFSKETKDSLFVSLLKEMNKREMYKKKPYEYKKDMTKEEWDVFIHSLNMPSFALPSEQPKKDHCYDTKPIPREPDEPPPVKRFFQINATIDSIEDLIRLIEEHPEDNEIQYSIDMHSLHCIKPHLIELNNMIGLHSLKKNIVDQILYFSQELHKNTDTNINTNDYLHTVIYGPPGTGKTEVAKTMGKLFSQLGILKKGTFKKVTRSDLVAGYLGQTAIKTRDVIQECIGGCLFIDEAYSLGNPEKKDIFSKECIDTLCEALSNHKEDMMVIIAGYEKELEECFFAYNKGLESRFTWRFKTDDYTGVDLYHIFCKKVRDAGWTLDETVVVQWFETKRQTFPYYGRDMETLFAKTKLAHSRRIFGRSNSERKKILLDDLEQGFTFFTNQKTVEAMATDKYLLSTMYI